MSLDAFIRKKRYLKILHHMIFVDYDNFKMIWPFIMDYFFLHTFCFSIPEVSVYSGKTVWWVMERPSVRPEESLE